ncbi:MAG: tetratricopeptide repeat protein [Planctomycetota bacterium]
MSVPGPRKPIGELFRGRWQIPLALLAAVVAALALSRLVPARPPPNFDALLADVDVLQRAGDTVGAADAVANLLELSPAPSPAQRAALHDRLAELIYLTERNQIVHSPVNARQLLEHDRAARDLGLVERPSALIWRAFAYQWLGEEEAALRTFRAALEGGLPAEERRVALRELVDLLERRPEAADERRQTLIHLLSDESVSAGYLWWGLHRAVRDALDEQDAAQARVLVDKYGDRLKTSDLKGYHEYLSALILLHEGRPGEATPLVRWIDEWLQVGTTSHPELDPFGHLPSLNRWLMGRIHLAEDRPQAALSCFDEVLDLHPGRELELAAGIGRGLALAALSRSDAALEAFRAAAEEAHKMGFRRRAALALLQRALLDLCERTRTADSDAALAYMALAADVTPDDASPGRLDLLERLAQGYVNAAAGTADPARRQLLHEAAGRRFEQAADLVNFDEPRLAELLWASAEAYDRAGRPADMQRMLERFVVGRSDHPRMPQAMLQLGRAHEAHGDLFAALRWYARVSETYPRLEEASRALVLSAGAFVSLGADYYANAEQTLVALLTNDAISPSAAVYRDALLALCDLLYYRGRYAAAISRLEDFLRLYPDDPEYLRVRFTLANAHRRSAYALRDATPPDVPPARAAAESEDRFRRAAELFAAVLQELDTAGGTDAALGVYARLALFYRGDCLFELNRPDTLQAALAAYRNAAARYDGQPPALAAQVQIANVLLRQGDVTEAARVVERARWLLRGMPAQAFAERRGGSRADWEQFLTVISSTPPFRDAFGGSP